MEVEGPWGLEGKSLFLGGKEVLMKAVVQTIQSTLWAISNELGIYATTFVNFMQDYDRAFLKIIAEFISVTWSVDGTRKEEALS